MAAKVPDDFDFAKLHAAKDEYFKNEPNLVAVFDYDYDAIIAFKTKVEWAQFLVAPPLWLTVLCCNPCFINANVAWSARAKHLALTVDGVKYVSEKHPAQCGLPCSDVGKVSRTVPYDKITDCDVQEPAGTAFCCCIQNVLSSVRLDTASTGGGEPELNLVGLMHPHDFKQAVWAMKRGQSGPQQSGVAPAIVGAPQQVEMSTTVLLTEIRDELRELNAHMRSQAKAI